MISRKRAFPQRAEATQTFEDGTVASVYQAGEALEVLRVRIYDQIDGSHMDVERYNERHYMSKWVAYCSVCRKPATADEHGQRLVRTHIRQAVENAASHEHADVAVVMLQEGQGNRCTACGATFIARPADAYAHITRAKAGGPKHRHAEVRLMRRFSLERPVLEETEATPVAEEEPAQVAPGGRRKSRRRRRHRGHRKGSEA